MVTNIFIDGTPSDADEVNQNFSDVENISVSVAELGVRTLQSNNVFTNGPNIIVDEFTDANGTKNTVNTGSSTAVYASSPDRYSLNGTLGTVESATISSSGSASQNISFDVVCNNTGIFNEIKVDISNSGTRTITCNIIKSGDIVASQSYGPTVSLGVHTFTFSLQDYLELFTNGDTATITIDDSTAATLDRVTGYSYDGTNIDIISQNVPGGVVPCSFAEAAFNSSSTVIVDTNTTTLDGNELGFAISAPDADIPANTSITATISDGTNSLSAVTIDPIKKGVVISNDGTLSSGTLKCTFTLNTTDTSVTPTLPSYGVNILR